jgi:hypothetical protein
VSIATRNPHSGQRNVTASEPSSGPSVEWSFIGSSQSRQRNFIAPAFYHSARAEVGGQRAMSRVASGRPPMRRPEGCTSRNDFTGLDS